MTEADEIGLRVLAELEEAGAENVSSTMNTVWPPSGENEELAVFQKALKALISSGFITFGYAAPTSGRLHRVAAVEALDTVEALSSLVRFDEARGIWVWDRTKPRAEIVATEQGLDEARRVLEERGYQWWRKTD